MIIKYVTEKVDLEKFENESTLVNLYGNSWAMDSSTSGEIIRFEKFNIPKIYEEAK